MSYCRNALENVLLLFCVAGGFIGYVTLGGAGLVGHLILSVAILVILNKQSRFSIRSKEKYNDIDVLVIMRIMMSITIISDLAGCSNDGSLNGGGIKR